MIVGESKSSEKFLLYRVALTVISITALSFGEGSSKNCFSTLWHFKGRTLSPKTSSVFNSQTSSRINGTNLQERHIARIWTSERRMNWASYIPASHKRYKEPGSFFFYLHVVHSACNCSMFVCNSHHLQPPRTEWHAGGS